MKTKISLQKCREYISHIQNISNLLGINEDEAEKVYFELLRLEREMHSWNEYEATYSSNEVSAEQKRFITNKVMDLLSPIKESVIINNDPRGYALKLKPEETPDKFIRDWGGYGLLAPQFI